MANPVTAKLTKLSNQYSVKVKRIKELEAQKKKPFVTDAEVKLANQEINQLTTDAEKDFKELAKLQKLEKTAKDYTKIQDDIKETQGLINKAVSRGESTTALDTKIQGLKSKLASIAPQVEKEFPELKVVQPSTVAPVPRENLKGDKGLLAQEVAAKVTGSTGALGQTPGVVDKAAGVKKGETPPKKKVTTPAGAYTTKEAADLANTVGGTNYFGAKYGTVTGAKTATGEEDINAIYALAKSQYGNVDSIFLYDPELKQLLIDAVGDPATAKDDMDPTEFLRRLNASDWAIRNATTYTARDAQRREYNETLDKYNRQLEMADTQEKKDIILSKIGQLKTTSAYARGLESAKAYIEATASGLTGTMSPERLDAFVKRMYDSANDKDPNIIKRELAALVSYKPGMQLGGAVGADLTTLRATARANGFDLDTSFGSSINDWLQRLAKGESIETFKNTIRGAAKLGLPDKVANLLDQGLDLKDIYEPYKKVMASVLEVAPDSISLGDKTLRMAIGPEKEMSIYDFERTLRKDARWQYTNNARQEASDGVLTVLRNFGFQG
jgi:hypothetical protein